MKKKTFHLVHILPLTDFKEESTNAQNMKFSVKVNKYEQIFNFLWICSHLLKTLKRKFHFFAVTGKRLYVLIVSQLEKIYE